VIDPRHARALETFLAAAGAVGDLVRSNTEWGVSGEREGQYAIDVRADEVCLEHLLGAGFAVLSEESGTQGPPGAPIVVVDPLDGSTNASRGIPWFASAMCLVDGDGPAVACVANHATGDRFTAIRGHGAQRDGAPISVSNCEWLGEAVVGVSGLPGHAYGWSQFRALGASAPDICAVACGVLDAWCDMSVDAHGVWDYLASILVVEEAGGVVAEVHGRELVVLDHVARRTPAVAASGPLLEQLLAERRRGGRTADGAAG
jgi:fructose-1,6-bisphosphatase/inositol monophosphatase family enzyme